MSGHRIPVAVLGATGTVGQRLVAMLDEHPWFELSEVVASGRSSGRRYADAVDWRLTTDLPARARDMIVRPLEVGDIESRLVFSALGAELAGPAEDALAAAGCVVVSNASAHRLDEDVPLLVPEINPHHAALIETQRQRRRSRGFIVTNPNCTTVAVVMALAPLHRAFGVKRVVAVSLQALSGAGIPGVPALAIADNVIPFIDGEAAKIEAETPRILGSISGASCVPADFALSARVHRVAVSEGHLVSLAIETGSAASPAEAADALRRFAGEPQELRLPSAPKSPVHVLEGPRPQPALDRLRENGMAVSVGSIEPCPVLGLRLESLVHNTVRGAAGAALLNAEWLLARGFVDGEDPRR